MFSLIQIAGAFSLLLWNFIYFRNWIGKKTIFLEPVSNKLLKYVALFLVVVVTPSVVYFRINGINADTFFEIVAPLVFIYELIRLLTFHSQLVKYAFWLEKE
jgi:hypothetical protein